MTDAQLKPNQETALRALLAGDSVTEAANAASVSRATLHRWLKSPEFLASFNGARREIRNAHEERLRVLTSDAIDAVEGAIQDGDARLALAFLKGMGFLDGSKAAIGSEEPEIIRQQQEEERRWDEMMRDLHSLG